MAERCEHTDADREPTVLNPDVPTLAYCRKCTVVVQYEDGKWILVGGVTKATYRYG